MPQITPLLTLVSVRTWHEESTLGSVVLLEASISLVCKCEEQNIVFGPYQGKRLLSSWHTGKILRHKLVQFACIFILLQGGHLLSNFFFKWDVYCNYCVCLVSQTNISLILWDGDGYEVAKCLNMVIVDRTTKLVKKTKYCHKFWWGHYLTLPTLAECSCLCCVGVAKKPQLLIVLNHITNGATFDNSGEVLLGSSF